MITSVCIFATLVSVAFVWWAIWRQIRRVLDAMLQDEYRAGYSDGFIDGEDSAASHSSDRIERPGQVNGH